MQRFLNKDLAAKYKSPSQKIRVLTESWVSEEIFCPSCGASIGKYVQNRPVADFYCSICKEDYELKSKGNSIGSRIVDGAFKTAVERTKSNHNPNLFLLAYDTQDYEVLNFFVIKNRLVLPPKAVLESWQKTLFLRKEPEVTKRGWILDIMNCIDNLSKKEFFLAEIYDYEKDLQKKHPTNLHIKDKIRQQLQILRDSNYLEFLGKGRYRLA